MCLSIARKQCWYKYSTALTVQAVNTALGICMTPERSGTCPPPKPTGVQPAGAQPVGVQPVGVQPVGVQPVGVQPLPRSHQNLSASERKKGKLSKRAGVIAGATAFAAFAVVAASLLAFFVHRRNGSTPVNGVTQTWRPSKACFWQNYLLADMSSTEQREQLIMYSYTGLTVISTCFKLMCFVISYLACSILQLWCNSCIKRITFLRALNALGTHAPSSDVCSISCTTCHAPSRVPTKIQMTLTPRRVAPTNMRFCNTNKHAVLQHQDKKNLGALVRSRRGRPSVPLEPATSPKSPKTWWTKAYRILTKRTLLLSFPPHPYMLL
jgi:hypothetical protein